MDRRKTLIILIALIIAVVAAILLASRSEGQNNRSTGNPTPPPAAGSQEALGVKLAAAKASYRYGDTIRFTSTVRNMTGSPKTYTFNSTCTGGKLTIDSRPTGTGQVCGQAITEITLQPDEAKTFDHEFKLVKDFSMPVDGDPVEYEGELRLQPGQHSAVVEWQDVKSDAVSFNVAE